MFYSVRDFGLSLCFTYQGVSYSRGHDADPHQPISYRQRHHEAVGDGPQPPGGEYGQYHQGVADDDDDDDDA